MLLYHGDFIKKRADLGEKEKKNGGDLRGGRGGAMRDSASKRESDRRKVEGRDKGGGEGVKAEENERRAA